MSVKFRFFSIAATLGVLLLTLSCQPKQKQIKAPGEGAPVYEPIYESEETRKIEVLAPRPVKTTGEVYIKDNLILINEKNQGLHVIDNTNDRNPVNLAFISIPGNTANYFNGNTLYADNYDDLLAIDITDIKNISIVHRYEAMMFNEKWALRPPGDERAYFVCPDGNMGKVIGWRISDKKDAKCFK